MGSGCDHEQVWDVWLWAPSDDFLQAPWVGQAVRTGVCVCVWGGGSEHLPFALPVKTPMRRGGRHHGGKLTAGPQLSGPVGFHCDGHIGLQQSTSLGVPSRPGTRKLLPGAQGAVLGPKKVF